MERHLWLCGGPFRRNFDTTYCTTTRSSCTSAPDIMEHSSPLAAMQPPSVLFGHCFRTEPTSYPSLSGFGQNSFNFKDLSMKKSSSDYFNMKPIRGSSPTASLAADLSQNFHIDQRFVFVHASCPAGGRTKNSWNETC